MTKRPEAPVQVRSMRIASYLIHRGLISLEQAQIIIKHQESGEGSHERFGQIAVRLGFINEGALERAVREKQTQSFR
jgi:hypothetical protein